MEPENSDRHNYCFFCHRRLSKSDNRSAETVVQGMDVDARTEYPAGSFEGRKTCNSCYFRLRPGASKKRRHLEEPIPEDGAQKAKDDAQNLADNFGILSNDQQLLLITAVGEHLSDQLRRDAEKERSSNKSLKSLTEESPGSYYAAAHSHVRALIDAISNDNTEVRLKARAIEATMQLTHRKLVTPLALKQSLLIASLTHSETVNEVVSACLPSGSSTTLDMQLDANLKLKEMRVLPGHIDVICSFDNQQILGRQHAVAAYRNNPISACTAIMHGFCQDSNLQLDSANTLENHLGKGHSLLYEKGIISASVDLTESERAAASTEMKRLYSVLVDRVQHEVASDYSDYLQELSSLLESADFSRRCLECGMEVAKNARVCRSCHKPLKSTSDCAAFLRSSVEQLRTKLPAVCLQDLSDLKPDHLHLGPSLPIEFVNDDPIFHLPNSYVSCVKIARHLGKRLDVKKYGGTRYFVVLACDGQPYTLLKNIISNHIVCSACGREFWGKKTFDAHNVKDHGEQGTADFEFDWILLQMGYGHLEMNLMKNVVKLFWDRYFESVAWVLNWRTDKALNVARNANDMHRTYDFFNIVRYSIASELLTRYLNEKRHYQQALFEDFVEFLRIHENSKVQEAWCFLRDFIQPLFVLRAGIRKNNSTLLTAGIKLSVPVFFASKATNYQQIATHHLVVRHHLPEAIRQFLQKTESIVIEGVGEGIDFRLEEQNRRAKKFLTFAAKEKHWTKVYQNLDDLDKVTLLETLPRPRPSPRPPCHVQQWDRDLFYVLVTFD